MRSPIVDETWPAPERAGFIASISSVGGSFARSDLPRSIRDQAVASGLISAVNHGVVTSSQTLLRALVRILARSHPNEADYAAQLAGIGAGLLAWASRGRVHHSDATGELGRRLARSCAIGLVATAAGELGGRLDGRVPDWLLPSRRPAAAMIGAVIAAVAVHRETAQRSTGSPPDDRAASGQLARSAALGAALSAALIGIGSVEHALVWRIATLLAPVFPEGPVGREAAAATGRGLVLWATASMLHEYVHRAALKSQQASSMIEERYRRPPQLSTVSGGPGSAVRYDTLGHEGARFVQRTTPVADITETMGTCRAAPVRAYIGWDSLPDKADHTAAPEQRAGLAIRELENLGGFDRAVLCVAVPAGTGFVNPVAVGALEYLTRGDCATIALQYSLRRSFYATNRVPLSAELNRLLLSAIADRVTSLPEPRRPNVLLYGESLGAWAAQATFTTGGPQALDELGVQSALFPGTPARSTWARQWRARSTSVDPDQNIAEVATYPEWCQLPDQRRAQTRVVLLSHADDPVTIFERSLLVRPARARGVLNQSAELTSRPGASFRPLTTFTLTAVDMKNAMGNEGGSFTTRGHDYRGDVVRFVAAAYNLPHDDAVLDRIEAALTRQLIPVTPAPSEQTR